MLERFKYVFKALFVPSDDFFKNEFNKINDIFKRKIGIDTIANMFNVLKSLGSEPFSDINVSVKGQNVKAVDFSFLNQYADLIRSFVGFLWWLLLALYHYNQIYFLIRGSFPTAPSGGFIDTHFRR